MEPIINASHVYIRYLLGDFRDIERIGDQK